MKAHLPSVGVARVLGGGGGDICIEAGGEGKRRGGKGLTFKCEYIKYLIKKNSLINIEIVY